MSNQTQHVLDAIDGALDDWSISDDAMRWTPEPVAPKPYPRQSWHFPDVAWHPIQAAALAETYGNAFREAAEAVAQVFATSADDVARLMATLADLGPLDQEEPDDEDPRARALRLRQQRNTGPDRDIVRQKRPRRRA